MVTKKHTHKACLTFIVKELKGGELKLFGYGDAKPERFIDLPIHSNKLGKRAVVTEMKVKGNRLFLAGYIKGSADKVSFDVSKLHSDDMIGLAAAVESHRKRS